LFDDRNFQLWRTQPFSQLLWVYGKRGCGKSYLASRVIEELRKACEESTRDKQDCETVSVSAYIYCNSLESAKVDPSKLLGSILKQLCHHLPKPAIDPWLERLYDNQSELRPPEEKEIKDAIVAILGRCTQTFLVVDGLDECHELMDDQFQDLCQFLRSLTLPRGDNSVVKVVAFSRPEYMEIKEAFSGCPFIQADAGLNNNDIKQFITLKLSGNGFHLKKNLKLLAEVERSLLSGADGMFLWVDLVVNSLKGQRTAKDIRATLRELPGDLDTVYENSIRKILEKDESLRQRALRTLLWIANAKRLLRRDELLEALAVEPDMRELTQDDMILDDDDFASDCADLIGFNSDGYYQLLHSSLKDYLCSPPTTKFNIPTEYRVMQENAEKIMAETCLTYLKFEKFETGPVKSAEEREKLLNENPFLEYASNYWGRHVAAADEIELRDSTKHFITSNKARDLSIQLFLLHHGRIKRPRPRTSTPLHALSIFDLLETAKSMPEIHSIKTQHDGFLFLPLDYALFYQSRRMCNWLLEKPDAGFIPEKPPTSLYPVIHTAALNDWGEVVDMLIAWKYDPECRYGSRQATPLHFAARNGSLSALEALIKAKADINVRDIHGSTPLIDAAARNHPKLAMRLLDEGAELNVHGLNGYTALHWAAQNGDASLAKLLLKGDDKDSVCAEEFDLKTPLHLAAQNNRHETLELLIAEGADIEKKTSDGYNAFLLSCENGSLKCAMSLLHAGVKMDVCTDFKETALHLAAANGRLDILEALFKTRPKQSRYLINLVNAKEQTALHRAVANGHKAEAKFLLANGVLVNKADKSGQYPFHYAAFYGHVDFISLLLKADADPKDPDDDSWTTVHHATQGNNLGFVRKLLEAVPTLQLAAKSDTGETSLHVASRNGFLELVAFFLERNIDPNIATKYGYTALHEAAKASNQKIVKMLLEAGGDGLYPSKSGETPFYFAVRERNVDVVDAFLEKGVNGCNISNNRETTCFHHVALTGNVRMLEKLTPFLDPAIIRQVNCIGEDAMDYAAQGGHVEMIDRLVSLGIPAQGLKMASKRPIHSAVIKGHFRFVSRLVELEADVNERALPEEMGPIHIATMKRMPRISEMLLKAGADPTERDVFGLNALDYAFRDPKVWEKMGKWKMTYRHTDLNNRIPTLRETVYRTVQTILTLAEIPTPKDEYERIVSLRVLGNALLAIGAESDVEVARLCFIELAYPPEFANYRFSWKCNICATRKTHGKWYLCKQCVEQDLCSACYLDYLQGGGTPKSAPKSLRVLRRLEDEIKPIREVCEDLADFGGEVFYNACAFVPSTADWLDEKAEEYDDWEKSYNDSGRFDRYQRPGQRFLKLVEKAREASEKMVEWEKMRTERRGTGKEEEEDGEQRWEEKKEEEKDKDNDGENNNHPFSTIDEGLFHLYAKHRPDKEIRDFACSNHEYLDIPNIAGTSETERKCFDADGKLTNEWLSKLLEKYYVEGRADMKANNHNKEDLSEREAKSKKEVLTKSTQESKARIADGLDVSTADQETLGVGALSEKPAKTDDTTGDIKKVITSILPTSRLIDVSSDPSTQEQMNLEASQAAGEIAGLESETRADPSNPDLLSTETIEKLAKLKEIKHALMMEMVEAEVQNREAAKSEGSPSLSNLFLICERAWQLAQVVTIGCVQRPPLRESILDDQEGLSSDDLDGLSHSPTNITDQPSL
jgi:ankyrin repeat protein